MSSAYTHESIPSPASLAFTCTHINSKGKNSPRGGGEITCHPLSQCGI